MRNFRDIYILLGEILLYKYCCLIFIFFALNFWFVRLEWCWVDVLCYYLKHMEMHCLNLSLCIVYTMWYKFILKKKINWIIRVILSLIVIYISYPIYFQMYIKHIIGYMIILSISYPVFIQLYIISCLYHIMTIKWALSGYRKTVREPWWTVNTHSDDRCYDTWGHRPLTWVAWS
jgi:hypothetical protein